MKPAGGREGDSLIRPSSLGDPGEQAASPRDAADPTPPSAFWYPQRSLGGAGPLSFVVRRPEVSLVNSPFAEAWVETPDGQSMYALINGDRGWLMYLRENGDSGFSSRNPNYGGPANAEIEYRLSNGQHDLYPASWALPVAEVRRALEYFESHCQRPPFITWHED
jgi:hypothetical protein